MVEPFFDRRKQSAFDEAEESKGQRKDKKGMCKKSIPFMEKLCYNYHNRFIAVCPAGAVSTDKI